MLEREAPVSGDVVGVRVRLEHALDAHTGVCGCVEVGLNREGRVDDHGAACRRITHQIRAAPEVLVHELAEEEHGAPA
jgi:hypothetical protein